MAAHAAPVSITPAADREAAPRPRRRAGDVRPALRRQHGRADAGPGRCRRLSIARRRRFRSCRPKTFDRESSLDAAPEADAAKDAAEPASRSHGRGDPARRAGHPPSRPSSRTLQPAAAQPEAPAVAAIDPQPDATASTPPPSTRSRPRRRHPGHGERAASHARARRRRVRRPTRKPRCTGRDAGRSPQPDPEPNRVRPLPRSQPRNPKLAKPDRPRNPSPTRAWPRSRARSASVSPAAPRRRTASATPSAVRTRAFATLPRHRAALTSPAAVMAKARQRHANCRAMIPLSVLDLSPVTTGISGPQALRNSLDLAPPRRPARLHPLLGGRAPQPAEHRELGARHHDRADRGGDRAPARRLRRRDAAEPRAAAGGRALQGAGRPVSRPHRSRPRPRAGHRPGDLLRAAAAPGRSSRRRFPRSLPGVAAVRERGFSGEPSVPQGPRDAGGRAAAADLSARLERLQRAARRPCRRGIFLRAPFLRFRSGRGR